MAVQELQRFVNTGTVAGPDIHTGADAIYESLNAHGIDTIFGYPGGAALPLYHRLRRHPIRHILVRHEQGASFMASGYGRFGDRLGATMATSGPGALNLITGLKNMYDDSTAAVAVTGQVAEEMIGTQAFQEADVVRTAEPNVKKVIQIRDPHTIYEQMADLLYIARYGRPGPVWADVPKNVQSAKVEQRDPIVHELNQREIEAGEFAQLQKIPGLLKASKKPLIIVGHGVVLSGAQKALLAFAEKTNIPIAYTLNAPNAFPVNHHLNAGFLGMHGNWAPNAATERADFALILGARMDDRVTGKLKDYLPNATVVQVDIDRKQLGFHVAAAVPVQADVRTALEVLLEIVEPGEYNEWLDSFKAHKQEEFEKVIKHDLARTGQFIRVPEVIDEIRRQTRARAAIFADVGQHQMFAARYYHPEEEGYIFTSGGLGAMGYALPAAIGAKIAKPDQQVIAVMGDGGAQMNNQELQTAVVYKVGAGFVVLNNKGLGLVEQWQEDFHEGNKSQSELENPSFVGLATAGYRMPAELVENRNELERGVRHMLESMKRGIPFLLEVSTDMEEKVGPMIIPGQAAHRMFY